MAGGAHDVPRGFAPPLRAAADKKNRDIALRVVRSVHRIPVPSAYQCTPYPAESNIEKGQKIFRGENMFFSPKILRRGICVFYVNIDPWAE